MLENYTFKVGDKVQLIEENIKKVNHGEIPIWFSDDVYTIQEITDRLDNDGYPIAVVKEEIPFDNGFKITTYFFKLVIKEIRKRKLNKIYESRR